MQTNLTNLENDFDSFLDDQLCFLSMEDKEEFLENLKYNISSRLDNLLEEDDEL